MVPQKNAHTILNDPNDLIDRNGPNGPNGPTGPNSLNDPNDLIGRIGPNGPDDPNILQDATGRTLRRRGCGTDFKCKCGGIVKNEIW